MVQLKDHFLLNPTGIFLFQYLYDAVKRAPIYKGDIVLFPFQYLYDAVKRG
ncbi:hypothetical protein QK342_16730 [Myroides odoratimimus]|uniref:hypothetical protein n=1 Tax=Myroides odoratimimus TaxID=76832 RepID=UPI0014023172|nr:hypothetical protein [Myroides odoratimimus]MCS7473030.1 hypothetical protein [Myroides odoratimimus]MDM1450704.1 hypothetical protein [Myroides odoratimimus]MDM1456791.1 hypothetical protein [Myroides odoratimimus]MDM1513630.1 hypothetical protein [Myroides odoratimimus]MEC4008271.1 hypothetical protein [Myroides odoratimimus]